MERKLPHLIDMRLQPELAMETGVPDTTNTENRSPLLPQGQETGACSLLLKTGNRSLQLQAS